MDNGLALPYRVREACLTTALSIVIDLNDDCAWLIRNGTPYTCMG
jgi:hypothetical protein